MPPPQPQPITLPQKHYKQAPDEREACVIKTSLCNVHIYTYAIFILSIFPGGYKRVCDALCLGVLFRAHRENNKISA